MDFSFSEEHLMLRSSVKEFTDDKVRPLASKIDENESIPESLIREIAEFGLLGTAFPSKYGGGDYSEIGFCIAQEEIAKACGSTATFIGAHQSIGANPIFKGGSESLKQKYLPPLCSGEKIASFALTEPEAGSDSYSIKTSAKLVGDKWILNGNKIWITNAAIADVFSVFARTEKGITGFVVDRNSSGIIIGANEKKLGIKGSVTNTITFEDVEVPKENVLGIEGKGFLLAMSLVEAGRLGIGACSVGAGKEMLELSANYSNNRKQFNQQISKFQAIQFMLAEMATKIYAMESLVYRAATKYDSGEDTSLDASYVKLFCSEAILEIADKTLQIHGGMGFSRELPIERYYRDSRILRIFEGTTEIQKLIIGRRIVKNNGKWSY